MIPNGLFVWTGDVERAASGVACGLLAASPAPLLVLRERLALLSNTDLEVGHEPRGSGARSCPLRRESEARSSRQQKKKKQAGTTKPDVSEA